MFSSSLYFRRFLGAILGGVCLLCSGGAIKAASLAGHKAVYNVQLVEARPSAKVANISGVFAYDLRHSCEGWASIYDYTLKYSFLDAPQAEMKTSFTTFETLDGSGFNFDLLREASGTVLEEIRGEAQSRETSEIEYSFPEARIDKHNQKLFFPASHTLEVIRRALKGERFFTVPLFDGSESGAIYQVSTVISDAKQYDAKQPARDASEDRGIEETLAGLKKWRVHLGFFKQGSAADLAEYEMSASLYENGILKDVRVDYHDFVLRQELVDLEIQEKSPCK